MKVPFSSLLNFLTKNFNIKKLTSANCPIQQNQVCLMNYNNCSVGKNHNCHQRFKFMKDSALYNFEVTFYGDDKRQGFVESDSISIISFIKKNKIELDSVLKES